MAKNNLAALRKKKGLSQAALAKLANTSQQQIQRIETGAQLARLDLAMQIAEALDVEIKDIFPGTKNTLSNKALKDVAGTVPNWYTDEKTKERLAKAGVDVDGHRWWLWAQFRNGIELNLDLTGPEYSRMWSRLQGSIGVGDTQVSFESVDNVVVINRRHLSAWQFRFEVPGQEDDDEVGSQDFEYEVRVWTIGKNTPLKFGVDADTAELDDEEAEDREQQFQNLLFMLTIDGTDPDDIVNFTDEDGETLFFRSGDIVALEIPKICTDPKLRHAYLEDEEEDAEEEEGLASD